jgi:hypothetical protein
MVFKVEQLTADSLRILNHTVMYEWPVIRPELRIYYQNSHLDSSSIT